MFRNIAAVIFVVIWLAINIREISAGGNKEKLVLPSFYGINIYHRVRDRIKPKPIYGPPSPSKLRILNSKPVYSPPKHPDPFHKPASCDNQHSFTPIEEEEFDFSKDFEHDIKPPKSGFNVRPSPNFEHTDEDLYNVIKNQNRPVSHKIPHTYQNVEEVEIPHIKYPPLTNDPTRSTYNTPGAVTSYGTPVHKQENKFGNFDSHGFDAETSGHGFDSGSKQHGFNPGINQGGFDSETNQHGFDSEPNQHGFGSGPNQHGFNSGTNQHGFNSGTNQHGFTSESTDYEEFPAYNEENKFSKEFGQNPQNTFSSETFEYNENNYNKQFENQQHNFNNEFNQQSGPGEYTDLNEQKKQQILEAYPDLYKIFKSKEPAAFSKDYVKYSVPHTNKQKVEDYFAVNFNLDFLSNQRKRGLHETNTNQKRNGGQSKSRANSDYEEIRYPNHRYEI